MAADPKVDLESRIDTLLLERIAQTALAMVWSLGALTIWALASGEWLLAALSAATQMYAAATWRLVRTGKIPLGSAGALSFANWLAAELTVLAALAIDQDMSQEIWLALLLWAYGSMQLRPKWLAVAFAVGIAAWSSAIVLLSFAHPLMHFVSVAGSAAVGLVAFDANRAVVRDLERLRAADEARRAELEAALEAARHEVVERKAAEVEREQFRTQFVEAQRLEALGNLAGGLAHDMNNILCGILGLVETMKDRARGEDAEDLEWITAAGKRGASLTRSLLGFSRRAVYKREHLRAAAVVHETVQVLRQTLPKTIEVVEIADDTVFVDADRSHLVQALLNVCINGTQAISDYGHIRVVVERRAVDAEQAATLAVEPGDYAVILVEDDGCGMDAAVRARAFEPFYTTKGVGSGTGLGLAMVWGMLRSHGGTATVESEVGRGTRVTMWLPRVLVPVDVDATPVPVVLEPVGKLHVLVVDDEPLVRRATIRMLERSGYRTSEAVDGVDALERVKAAPDDVDAVLLDMSMPRMSGSDCYQALRNLKPALPIVCVSGHALDVATREFLGGEVYYVTKPYRLPTLLSALTNAVRAGKSVALPS